MGLKKSENRKSFRVPVNLPAIIYRRKDKGYQNPERCILVDIGVGGACVKSEYRYAKNEILNLRIKLGNYRGISLLGQVIRITEMEFRQYRYGILFAQVWDSEHIRLSNILSRMRAYLIAKNS